MASWYLTLAYPLAERGMRVLLHDLRGHGRSDVPTDGYALDDFVNDLEGLLAGWGVTGPVHLFGNSFGGTVAFGYALRHPDRVAAITAIDSAPPTAAWFDRMGRRLGRAATLTATGRHAVSARRLRDVQRLLAETTIATELPASRLPDPAAFAAVTCPVLCLYGGDSPMLELAGPTQRLLPQTRTVVLENAGHSMLVDRAAWIGPSSSATVAVGPRCCPISSSTSRRPARCRSSSPRWSPGRTGRRSSPARNTGPS
jgi:pimeloyl-ACP methyl ester carboxylesterase